jgi:serine/threonine protein kinase
MYFFRLSVVFFSLVFCLSFQSPQVDIWSAGLVLLELLTGEPVWKAVFSLKETSDLTAMLKESLVTKQKLPEKLTASIKNSIGISDLLACFLLVLKRLFVSSKRSSCCMSANQSA